jgi:diadenosine tetraphosphate (Ap4A) HIT family hydrolase
MVECPFCQKLSHGEVFAEHGSAVALLDSFPVSRGHLLLVPRRHVADVFELSQDETRDLMLLLGEVRGRLQELLSPAGFNVGVNVGAAAGQTVPHAHVHVIPRYAGDVPDPRGGVRRVLPHRAAHWDT